MARSEQVEPRPTSLPEGEEIFSKTTRKLPVQLNRKQYENLFESFDYTKEEATVDGDEGRVEREERQRAYSIKEQEKDILSGARKQWATIRLAKRIAFLLSN